MSTKFFTNEGENTLLQKFRGVFENSTDIECFDALVGYFRSSGYFAIRPYLERVPRIRVLVGINADKLAAKHNEQGLLFRGDHEATVKESLENLKKDIAACAYEQNIEQGILDFVQDVVTGKIEIRAHPTRRLHAKIYIFRPSNWNEHRAGQVITGSANLTKEGLGDVPNSNYEFNVLLNDYDDICFATSEFEKLWAEAVPILPTDVENIKDQSHLNESVTPFELYVKMLATYFGKEIDYNPDSVDIPKEYKELAYQIDAVNQGYAKLIKYNGFFLADVVGLGKTIVAMMIAKKFFFSNGYPGHISRILVITPPAVKKSWEEAVQLFGLKTCKIITNGSIEKEAKHFKTYDLVIVDEAHKFRTATSDGYSALQRLCKSTAPVGGALGKNPQKKKIILLSATPVNNKPEDIENQVYLFQDKENTDLDIPSLGNFFGNINKEYDSARAAATETAKLIVEGVARKLRDTIISPLTVRRTRADLLNNEEYKKDLEKQGITFPTILPPRKLYYRLNETLETIFDRTIECLTSKLNYSRYQAIRYLLPEIKAKHFPGADDSALHLQHIMKCLLIKRLDSSFFAFKKSLTNFYNGVSAMLKMLDNDQVYIINKANISELVLDGDDEELLRIYEQKKEAGTGANVFKATDFEEDFRIALSHDLEILKSLVESWATIEDDPKYDEFIARLEDTFLDKKKNPSGKLIVFSEAEDTTQYLSERLGDDGIGKILVVNSGTRDSQAEAIRSNFDANIETAQQRDDYDIIITTEVLAEGVNLHRAALIVNYDTPWNSTRLMQRLGRINRIGSPHKELFIYNFFPTSEVNDHIQLEKKAILKLYAFHHALDTDSQIYSPDDETPGSFGLFDNNANEEQDVRLRALLWLRQFRENHPSEFARIAALPLKARCGRQEDPDTTPPISTTMFLRNEQRYTFYSISGDTVANISFLDAEKLLRCSPDTPRQPLPIEHYAHVGKGLHAFDTRLDEDAAISNTIQTHHTPTTRGALAYLDVLKKWPTTDEATQRKIQAAQQAINEGRFSKLTREVTALKKQKPRTEDAIEKILAIIKKYDIESPSEVAPTEMPEAHRTSVIISETITAHSL